MLTDLRHRGESFVFLGILFFIVAVFLFSNVDNLMTRMGFETKSVVKAQLAKTTEQLKAVIETNNNTQKELELQIKAREAVEIDLTALRAKQVVSAKVVTTSKAVLSKKVSTALQRIQTTKIVSPPGVTSIVTKDMDEVARADIESIHLTYKKLFNT